MPFKWIFDLKELQTAILEENGRISFLAKSEHRPVSPSDLNLSPHKEWLLQPISWMGKFFMRISYIPEKMRNGSENSFLHMAVNACLTYFLQQGINRIL